MPELQLNMEDTHESVGRKSMEKASEVTRAEIVTLDDMSARGISEGDGEDEHNMSARSKIRALMIQENDNEAGGKDL